MSRTEQTDPLRVKCLTEKWMIEEDHDHTDGVCDLPPRPRHPDDENLHFCRAPGDTACFWVPSSAFWRAPLAVCQCRFCSRAWSGPDAPRKDRFAWRAEVRDAVADLDTHGLHDDLSSVPAPSFLKKGSDELELSEVGAAMGLPEGSWVVDLVRREHDPSSFADQPDAAEALVDVMYPDGDRERLVVDKNGAVLGSTPVEA